METDLRTHRPTGRAFAFQVATRAEAAAALLALLEVTTESASVSVSASGALVVVGDAAWTIVAPPRSPAPGESSSLRRGGPTHRSTS